MPALSRRDFLKLSGAAVLTAWGGIALAQEQLVLRQAELIVRGEAYVLAGGYNMLLPSTLDDALHKGITLTFMQAFEAELPRDWWFAEDVTVQKRPLRLSYNALLKQYQLQREVSHLAFDNLADALAALGDFADWPVLERRQIHRKNLYRARVRMFLDTSRLAKPLQMNAFASSRWDMDSGWREWSFKP